MKRFHGLSFILGLASGLVILVIVVVTMNLTGAGRRGGFGGNGPNLARMAQRFGMTQAELQTELSSGKTLQQIAQEHGVQFGGGFGRNGGAVSSASGQQNSPGTASSASGAVSSSAASL